MTNYYEILGLSVSAGHAEIKTAFRRLAKLYHPDKNAHGKEHFEKILKAYEILSDPVLKSSYDYKLNYHLGQGKAQKSAPQSAGTKNWRFDEKEMKRRQYYNEHFKKSGKTTSQYTAEVETKKSYNEYKYILFATPLAVALFLLIMNLAMPEKPALEKGPMRVAVSPAKETDSQLKMGDMPYAVFFGGAKYDTAYKNRATFKNASGADVVVCLFTKKDFIRSFYIRDNFFAEASQLPDEPLFVRYSSGLNFRYAAGLKEAGVTGGFTKQQHFFKSNQAFDPVELNDINILPGKNKGFTEIGEKEFFEKKSTTHDKKN